jgi:hypothetical protein
MKKGGLSKVKLHVIPLFKAFPYSPGFQFCNPRSSHGLAEFIGLRYTLFTFLWLYRTKPR